MGQRKRDRSKLDRRDFFKTGSAVVAGSALLLGGSAPTAGAKAKPKPKPGRPAIRKHHKLGRTGFQASDISMGCGEIAEPNVVRYAYDRGVNHFDTAEVYENGGSETKIGKAMKHLDREKIFIVTKLKVKDEDTEQTLLDRFGKCLERMQTTYADALYSHSVTDVKGIVDVPIPVASKQGQLMVFYGSDTPDVELDLTEPRTEVELEVEKTILKVVVELGYDRPKRSEE